MTQSFKYINFEGDIKAKIESNSLIDPNRYYDDSFRDKEWNKLNIKEHMQESIDEFMNDEIKNDDWIPKQKK